VGLGARIKFLHEQLLIFLTFFGRGGAGKLGNRRTARNLSYCDLDMIISNGYRVNSKRAPQRFACTIYPRQFSGLQPGSC
jgi:hypothetical protein